jgi:hypothetical protein
MKQVEPFAEFLVRTANARPDQYIEALRATAKHHGLSPEEATAEFERMKSYILSFYEGVTPVCSFLNTAGQPVDCVPFEQQPAVRAARAAGFQTDVSPPTPATIAGNSLPNDVEPVSAPVSGNSRPPGATRSAASPSQSSSPHPPQIPPGTAPLLRITLDRLIPMGRLDSFFHKNVGPPTTDNQTSFAG